ncbi:MAG: alpha/beta fold hydrolase, partial [Parvimonas sp.]|uniref:alpha/beta fold hydrolase n=1 Tax=Parvimonas sp. TaxID=1944660 RepID=UPI0025E52D23
MNKFKKILRIFLTLSLILSVMSNSLYAKDFTVESGKLFNENNKIVKRVVEENNIERIVESKEPSYTVIIMDMSGTMDGKPEKEQRKTVKNFYKSVVKANSENKVALISIDSVFVLNTSRVLCDFTNDLEELNKGMEENTVPLGKSYFDYGLNKSEALFKEVEEQKNKKVIKNIVICSDGIPSGGLEETEKGMYSKSDHENYKIANEVYNITKKLKENGITIYTVGFFQNLEGKELAFGERFMKDIAGKGEYKEDNADSNKGNNKDNENKRNENNRNDYGHNNKNNGNNKRDDVNPDKDKKDPDSGKSEPNIDNFPEYESEDKDPIIIIPGIMGSRLFISEDYSDNTKAWDPEARLLNNVIMLRERLKPNNHLYVRPCENQQKYSEGDKDSYGREYGTKGAYKTLVDSICKRFPKREVYVFSYDWRKSNSVSAEKLNEEIKKILKQTGKESVDIVAHSMGGLVASSYYSKYGSEKVDKIITCGTPYEGAPLLINSIMNWDILSKPQDPIGWNDLDDWALGFIGGVQRKLKVSFNGVAELMPTKNYVSKFPMKQDSWKPLNKGDYDLNYEDYVTKHCNRIFGKENYSSALNFQNSILENGYNKLLNHYRSYFLIGTNQKTVTSIKF